MQVNKTRYPDNHVIPMYKSTIARWRWLQKTHKGDKIPMMYPRTHNNYRNRRTSQLVGRHFLHSRARHVVPHWDLHEPRKKSNIHIIHKTEIEHQTFCGGWAGGHRWLNSTNTMDKTFFSCTKNVCTYNTNLPGKRKYNNTGWKQ